jgi:DNA helicase-2/ATP-dependent DNA helicase PcrA
LNAFEHDEEEAREIVDEIEFNRLGKRIAWGDHAILFRTNQQSRMLELELRRQQVKYNLIGGQSFFDRREIRDFLAYLKMFMNPHDDMSLLRIANTPTRGLSDVTMQRLLGHSQDRNCSVYAAMRHSDVQESLLTRTCNSVQAFLELIEEFRAELEAPEAADDPAGLQNWATRLMAEVGYFY